MATLTIPRATWQAPPNSRISSIATTTKGDKIILGMSNGTLIIFTWNFKTHKLVPTLFCIGPFGAVISLLCYKIDLDGLLEDENVVCSINDKGDIALWNLNDGQCLQTRHERNDGVQGILQGVDIHSSGVLVCYGECNHLVILDGATLEILKSFDLFGTWIVSVSLFPTSKLHEDRLIMVDADGTLHAMLLNMQDMTCRPEGKQPHCDLSAHTMGNTIDIIINKYDPQIFLVLEKDFCEVLCDGFESVCRIQKDETMPAFQGAQFLSAKTLLIWDDMGGAILYYLGKSTDLHQQPVNELASSDVILISDGANAVFVKSLGIGPYTNYCNWSKIAVLPPNSFRCRIFLSQSDPDTKQQSLIAFTCEVLQKVEIYLSLFWGSLYKSNMPFLPSSEYTTLNDHTLNLKINETIEMKSLWPVVPAELRFTAMACFMKKYVVVGYVDGIIGIIPQTVLMMEDQSVWLKYAIYVLRAHFHPITALFVHDYYNEERRKYLLSGDSAGHVVLWDGTTGAVLASFYDHSLTVLRFILVPKEVNGKFKNAVMSVGQDNTLSLINIDEASSTSFIGHGKEIRSVNWRIDDDSVMIVQCVDDSVHVWNLKSGQLEKVETGQIAKDIVASYETKIEYSFLIRINQDPNSVLTTRQTFSVATFPIGNIRNPILCVYQINIKALIDEMNNGEIEMGDIVEKDFPKIKAPISEEPNDVKKPRKSLFRNNSNSPGGFHFHFGRKSLGIIKKVSNRSKAGLSNSSRGSTNSKIESESIENENRETRGWKPDNHLVGALFSIIMSWGLNEELDTLCEKDLHLIRPVSGSIGCRGAGGYLSFPIPTSDWNPEDDWNISPTLTTQRLLTIVAMVRSLVTNYKLELDATSLMIKFGSILPPDGPNTYKPSLPMLIKFWQDSVADVHEATRFLVSRYLTKISNIELNYGVNNEVPIDQTLKSRLSCKATVILALIASVIPESVNLQICKDLAYSLNIIVTDAEKNPYRLLAIELLGAGFRSWEPHMNCPAVLRTLFNLTGFNGQQTGSIAFASPPNMLMARKSLLLIASANTALFISTLTFDLVHVSNMAQKVGCLKLLGMFITRKPLFLYPHLLVLVNSMVKILDPNHPNIREAIQNTVTVNFAELVKVFPCIDFHANSQRLAVGCSDGTTVIYDLRTANKIHVLNQGKGAVHGVSFSPEGSLIVTLSLDDSQITFWQPSVGLFDSIRGALVQTSIKGISFPGMGKISPYRSFPIGQPVQNVNIQEALDSVKFQWTSERSVEVFSANDMHLKFAV